MADIIYTGQQQKTGLGISLGDILPIAALGVLALGAYWVLKGGLGTNGTPSQGMNTGPAIGPATGNGGTQNAGTQEVNNANGGSSVADQVRQLAQQLANASTRPTTVTQVGNAPAVIVEAGKNTPVNFFPSAQNVIATSRQLSPAEQAQVVQNLVSSQATQGITNAWWQEPTVTNPQNWGINSAGSPQSNIPSGTRHCQCTAALRASGVCGPNDDWYYC
jgi:hypothetical protein